MAGLNICDVLRNGANTDIAVTTSSYDDLMSLIAYYEGESLAPAEPNILADLKSDLNAHNGDTKADLETHLAN